VVVVVAAGIYAIIVVAAVVVSYVLGIGVVSNIVVICSDAVDGVGVGYVVVVVIALCCCWWC